MLKPTLLSNHNNNYVFINTIFFKSSKYVNFGRNKLLFNSFIQGNLFLQIRKFYFNNVTICIFFKQKLSLKSLESANSLVNLPPVMKLKFFTKYFYNGLGYKIFLRGLDLFVWVGLTHYTIVKIPPSIKVFPKKRRIFIVGNNLIKFKNFLMQIRRIRKIDLYKGKGLLEIKTYKGFIKMKSGKKKQY